MDRSRSSIMAAVALGLIGGYAGTKALDAVTIKLSARESEAAAQQEKAVSPGNPYTIGARKLTKMLGLTLSDEQLEKVGNLVFHYGLGISWGAIYPMLRLLTGLGPVPAGLLTGGVLWLVIDEGLTPVLGLSAPDSAYPWETHVRGALGHLAYGATLAATVEALGRLGRLAVCSRQYKHPAAGGLPSCGS